MSVSDLVRRFKRTATDGQASSSAKKAFDWEPERAMSAPRPAAAKAMEPAPVTAVSKPAAVSFQRPVTEVSSVIGSGIPADVADFGIVYKGAAVQAPSHGYGVDRIGGMLAHESLAGLDKTVKASAVLAALDAAGVSIEDVIHDGLLRYKTLVAFEAAKELELQQVRPRNERRIEELRRAVAAFEKEKQAEIDALTRESAAAVNGLTRLQTRQRAEEERFQRTLSLFVEPMPARVLPMVSRPLEGAAAEAVKPELKLAPASPAPVAEVKPEVKRAESAPAPPIEPAKEDAKS
jgi:hypothetical protein